MIHPADRLNTVTEYYFSVKLKEVAQMNAAGKRVINLGIGNPDLPPPPDAIDALCADARRPDAHGYQPYTGLPALRRALAAWYARWYGVELDPDTEIQPLIGSKEGVLHTTLAFVNPGEGVLVPDPGYPTYTSASRLCGAHVIPYRLDEAHGWQPDFDTLERMDLTGVRLMWVNYPNMPTGARATRTLFERLVAFGRRHDIVVVNDNPYSFILNDERLSILSVEGAREVCIELNSMSKSHHMAGWRMAMLASNAQFVQWVLKVKSNVDSGMSRPLMAGAVAALQSPPEWHEEMNRTYARRRVLAARIMDALGCRYDEEQAGMFLWARIPDGWPDAAALADEVLYGRSVFITPGHIFGPAGTRYVRISLCCNEPTLEEALQRITKN